MSTDDPLDVIVTAATPTIQDKIMQEIITRITAMKHANGAPVWNQVQAGPVDEFNNTSTPAAGVDQGGEDIVDYLYPIVQKNLSVYVDFRYEKIEGLDSYRSYRYYLGQLQKTLFGDENKDRLGGLANNIQETGSNPQIQGSSDNSPGGVLMFTVQYEHYQNDPTKGRNL